MKEMKKTKRQLLSELEETRRRVATLEARETDRSPTEPHGTPQGPHYNSMSWETMEQSLRASRQELALRNRIAAIFLTVPNEDVYAAVLDEVLDALRSEYGYFGYIDEEGNLVSPSLTRGIWEKCEVPEKNIVFPREKWGGLWGRSLREKKTLCSNRRLRVPEGHVPLHRALVVPIVHQGELIGQFAVANKDSDYDDADRALLETIAAYVAPVLQARLENDRQARKRRQAEEALSAAKARLQHLVSASPAVIYSCEPSGDYAATFISEVHPAEAYFDSSRREVPVPLLCSSMRASPWLSWSYNRPGTEKRHRYSCCVPSTYANPG